MTTTVGMRNSSCEGHRTGANDPASANNNRPTMRLLYTTLLREIVAQLSAPATVHLSRYKQSGTRWSADWARQKHRGPYVCDQHPREQKSGTRWNSSLPDHAIVH